MHVIIKEGNLAVSREVTAIEGAVSAESALIAAYDVISRIFGQQAVIRAYMNTDPDTMDLRARPLL